MNLLLNPTVNRLLITLDDNTSMASVVLRDGMDNVGRAHQAFQRNSHDGRERVIEENLTTLIWGFGIRFMKDRVYDPIARRLGLLHPGFDMALLKDGPQKLTPELVRQLAPHDQHLLDLVSKPELQKLYHKSNVAKFVIATGIPILLIAFGIPTFNQWLTRRKLAQGQTKAPAPLPALKSALPYQAAPLKRPALYQHFQGYQAGRPNGRLQFGGLGDSLAVGISNILQNGRANNMVVDGVITSGRTLKARNRFERLEVLFQEASVIFFLYFAQSMIQRFVERWMDRIAGSITGMGFGELKHLRDTFGDDTARFVARQKDSLAAFRPWLQEAAMPEAFEAELVKTARQYVASGQGDNLLLEMARQAGKIPVVKTAEGRLLPDLTRKIEADGIFKTAQHLERLAQTVEAQSGGLQKLLSRSMTGKFLAFLLSSGICTLFLGYLIPKTKQWMTYKLTGSKEFPGIMNLEA